MYKCGRCDKQYSKENLLKRHKTQRKIPCDLFCFRCETKYKNRYAYTRHEQDGCIPSLTKIEDITKQNADEPLLIIGDQFNITVNLAIGELSFNNPNLEQLSQGIIPHEYDTQNLLRFNTKDMYAMFQTFLNAHPDGKYSNNDLLGITIKLVQLFYSNEKTPQYMNIYNDDSGSNYHKVYSGKEFIEDLLPKNIRNKRLIQILIYQLREYINCYQNPPIISGFVYTKLIPFIITSYFGELCTTSIDEALKHNAKYIKKLYMKKIPEYPFTEVHLVPSSFKAQFSDFREGEKQFQQDLKIILERNLNNIEIEIIKKQNIFLKN